MEPSGQIAPQPWMTAPETRAVVAALTAEGAEVRFVGGCVRDALLGRPVRDIDIATHDAPEKVMELLARGGVHAIPTGIEHGTVTAVVDAHHFEITTLRLDVETFGRRARVAFTDDWREDASRRDFTINALFLAPDGTLFDPFGGLADLEAGRVRFVGDAEQRIREDVLRLLRFFRFHAWYGKGAPDADALAACRRLAGLLPTLSAERVAGELLRLLAAPDPAPAVRLMVEDGILAPLLPEARAVDLLAGLVAAERAAGADADPLRRLAALLAVDRAGAGAVAERLRFSNAETKRLAALALPRPSPALADGPARRRDLYRLGADLYRDLALLNQAARAGGAGAEAGAGAERDGQALRAALAAAREWTPPRLPVGGEDAKSLGVPEGPEIGKLLAAVESWWMENDFRPDRAACLERMKELAKD